MHDWKQTNGTWEMRYLAWMCIVSPVGRRFEWALLERGWTSTPIASNPTIWFEHYRGRPKTLDEPKEDVEEALAEEIVTDRIYAAEGAQ